MYQDIIYRPEFNLNMRFYFAQTKPAHATVIFYFGGGWKLGNPLQFEAHAQALSEIGFNVALPDYRVSDRWEGCTPRDCVADAIAAVQFLADHHDEYGVNTQRFILGGGSAGGHLALCAELLGSHRAIGLLLYNPAAVIPEHPAILKRFGSDYQALSPYHLLNRRLPPTIIFHGLSDTTVPFTSTAAFAEKARNYGSEVQIVAYVGKTHGFFNLQPDKDTVIAQTVDFVRSHFM